MYNNNTYIYIYVLSWTSFNMFMVKGREISAEDLSKNINGLSEVGKGCIGGKPDGGFGSLQFEPG